MAVKTQMIQPLAPSETVRSEQWQYLEQHSHPWRRQLYIKGRRQRAFSVWSTMQTEGLSIEEAAENWDLPLEAVREIIRYCEKNEEFLNWEAAEEGHMLRKAGVRLEPPPFH